ncbi:MAG TPA: hypothetical protein VIJ25_10840, partial [Methylococcales bacterium]
MMTSRERVLASINHRCPDRTPIDLGSTIMTGIMATALDALRKRLGLDGKVRVHEIFQMLGEVEMDIVEAFGVDVLPVTKRTGFFNIKRENYKPCTLFDGTNVMVPGDFNVETGNDGRWIFHESGERAMPIVAVMPKGGYYFDVLHEMTNRPDFVPPPIEDIGRQYNSLTDEELNHLSERALWIRRNTDKAAVIETVGATGISGVGSLTEFLVLLMTEKNYVMELLDKESQYTIENMKLLWQAVGDKA